MTEWNAFQPRFEESYATSMDEIDAKRTILARRARFVAAALASLGGCAAPAAPATHVGEVAGPVDASAAPRNAALEAAPAIADAGAMDAQPDSARQVIVSVCLSIIIPPRPSFDWRSHHVRRVDAATLDETAKVLKANPEIVLGLEGNTDPTEPDTEGLARAHAIQRELVNRGVEPARIVVTNAGSTKPREPNTTDLGRARNRRVEMQRIGP